MTFLGDEGRDAIVVYNILHGKLTLLGPTASVGGFFLGPIYYYFMAPFLWLFNYNPVGPAVMVALFGIATVFLIYKIGLEFFDRKTAIFASTLYAISPLVLAYSRSSWNPNLMPFFSLLSVYFLYKAIAQNKFFNFVLVGILYGISLQLHYIETFFGVAIVLYIFFIRIFVSKKKSILKIAERTAKDYVSTFVGFLIGFSPFLAFEIRHGFPNIKSILDFILNSGETGGSAHFAENIGSVFFRLFGRLLTNFPPPEQISLGTNLNITIWYYLTLLLGIASVLICLIKLFKSFKKRDEKFLQYSSLIFWLIIGIFLFGFYKKPIYDYYFEFMFPVPFLLVGLFISSLYTNIHEWARYIVGNLFKLEVNRGQHESTRIKMMGRVLALGIFAAFFYININAMPFKNEGNRQMEQVRQIAEFALSKTDGKPFNFALITGGNSDHGYRYFMKLKDRDPIAIENTDNDPQRKTVTDQLLIVCEDTNCKPLGNSLWEVAGFGRAEIVGEWNVSVVKVYKLIHYKGN